MVVKNKYFIVLMITLSLFIGNSEAGWKFWKKDKETTTTMSTTTSVSVNVQSTIAPTRTTKIRRPTVPIANTKATLIDANDLKLDITGENIQNNIRSNLRTEFATDTDDVSRSNRPGIDHGNVQNYRKLTVDLIETKEPQNQASKISQGLTIKSDRHRLFTTSGVHRISKEKPKMDIISSTNMPHSSKRINYNPNTSSKRTLFIYRKQFHNNIFIISFHCIYISNLMHYFLILIRKFNIC
ncbi:hypothetical protein ACFW04_011928 [Cataglyphis niger]